MAIDDETTARIRQALDESERLDAQRIDLGGEDDVLVLRGAVATPEEASVAAMIAEREGPPVRNELTVDPNLREGSGQGRDDPAAGDEAAMAAMDENLAWDPPDHPAFAPTAAEEAGALSRDATAEPTAPEGQVDDPDDVEPSAPDLSAAELRQTARPRPDHDDQEDR